MFLIKWIVRRFMFKKLKSFLGRKAKAATKSATMGVAGGLLALAAFLQSRPDVVEAVVGQGWGGIVVAVAGVAVAVARARTLG